MDLYSANFLYSELLIGLLTWIGKLLTEFWCRNKLLLTWIGVLLSFNGIQVKWKYWYNFNSFMPVTINIYYADLLTFSEELRNFDLTKCYSLWYQILDTDFDTSPFFIYIV